MTILGRGNRVFASTVVSNSTLIPLTILRNITSCSILYCTALELTDDTTVWKWKSRAIFTQGTFIDGRRSSFATIAHSFTETVIEVAQILTPLDSQIAHVEHRLASYQISIEQNGCLGIKRGFAYVAKRAWMRRA